jgi:hypothetical protein
MRGVPQNQGSQHNHHNCKTQENQTNPPYLQTHLPTPCTSPLPLPYLPPDLRPIRYRYKLRRKKTEKKKFYLYSSGGSSKASGSSSMPSVGVLHIAGGNSSGVTITNAQGRIFSQQKSSLEIRIFRISTLSPALNWEIYPIRR